MPAKPTKLPVWGKTTAPITEPSAAFQGAGYVEGDKPAADHLNFLFTAFSEWVTDWLDATFGDHEYEVQAALIGYGDLTKNLTTYQCDVTANNDAWVIPLSMRPGFSLVSWGVWDISDSAQTRDWSLGLIQIGDGALSITDVTKEHSGTAPFRSSITSSDTGTLPFTVPTSSSASGYAARLQVSSAGTPTDVHLCSIWFQWERLAGA